MRALAASEDPCEERTTLEGVWKHRLRSERWWAPTAKETPAWALGPGILIAAIVHDGRGPLPFSTESVGPL